jgi:GDSL-like lipase/acylhydrolase family protein
LVGDSILDNAAYVGADPAVADQLRDAVPVDWRVTLAAVDGASAADVASQLEQIDATATHLIVSTGGNDALNWSGILGARVTNVAEAVQLVGQGQARFRGDYEEMAARVLRLGLPAVFCTVYDAIPGLDDAARVALSAFNDVILRTAFRNRAAVIDLRLVCDEAADYSSVSPIEPSARGGAKIARVIAKVVRHHAFGGAHTVVFA